jgi:nucleoside-diphosphate-sugar epimerase
MRAMFADYHGFRAFNVGGGRQTTLNQLHAELQRMTGASVVPAYAEARAGDIRHSAANIELIQQELGYVPSRSLNEGLRLLLDSLS